MNKISRRFRNLKMNQQVLLIGTIIMTFVLLLILETCIAQTYILFSAIQSSSQAITTKQEKRSIQQSAIRIKEYLERKYHQGIHTINLAIYNILHIDKFFETTLSNFNKFSTTSELFPFCKSSKENSTKINIAYNSDSFCYQSLQNQDGITLSNTQEIIYYQKTVSMLSQYTQLFDLQDNSQLLIFDPQMMISYPQNYQLKNYSLEERVWFKYYENHKKSILMYSPVFLSAITNDLTMMVMKTIFDESGSSIGFTTETLSLNDKNIEAVPINQQIIMEQLDAKQQILIYNSTYTGFNESDWELIKGHSNLPQYQCSGFPNTFCLYNKYFSNNVQVEVTTLNENFILVVFVNVTFSTQLEEQYSRLFHDLQSKILQIEVIQIIACFLMIAITSFMIQILFLPLFHLMNSLKLHIKTMGNNIDKQIINMSRRLTRQQNIFSKLSMKFMTFEDFLGKNQSQKSDLCQKIERFFYHRKPKQYDLSKIKSIISQFDAQVSRFKQFSNKQLDKILQQFTFRELKQNYI